MGPCIERESPAARQPLHDDFTLYLRPFASPDKHPTMKDEPVKTLSFNALTVMEMPVKHDAS